MGACLLALRWSLPGQPRIPVNFSSSASAVSVVEESGSTSLLAGGPHIQCGGSVRTERLSRANREQRFSLRHATSCLTALPGDLRLKAVSVPTGCPAQVAHPNRAVSSYVLAPKSCEFASYLRMGNHRLRVSCARRLVVSTRMAYARVCQTRGDEPGHGGGIHRVRCIALLPPPDRSFSAASPLGEDWRRRRDCFGRLCHWKLSVRLVNAD